MKQVATYVGIDAHKKDLFVAMLIGATPTPAGARPHEMSRGFLAEHPDPRRGSSLTAAQDARSSCLANGRRTRHMSQRISNSGP